MSLFRNDSVSYPASSRQNIHEMTILSLDWQMPFMDNHVHGQHHTRHPYIYTGGQWQWGKNTDAQGPCYYHFGSRLYHIVTEDKFKSIQCIDRSTGQRLFSAPIPHPKHLDVKDVEIRLTILRGRQRSISSSTTQEISFVLAVSTNFGQLIVVDAISGRIVKRIGDEATAVESWTSLQRVATAVQEHNDPHDGQLSNAIYHARHNVIQLTSTSFNVLSRYTHPVKTYSYQEPLALTHVTGETDVSILFAILRNDSSLYHPDILDRKSVV